jgi:D-tyrosyl-tRNA(Tyr) deacylase
MVRQQVDFNDAVPEAGAPMRYRRSFIQPFIAAFGLLRLNRSTMRAVIQRVSTAEVAIAGAVAGAIGPGLLVLIAIEEADNQDDVEWLSGKIVRLRIFDDAEAVMNRSVQDIGGGVLAVSQFTLFASTRKGNRPSYSRAARPEIAIPLYEAFLNRLATDLGRPVQSGQFGADMHVRLTNDGPVTLIIDSKQRE